MNFSNPHLELNHFKSICGPVDKNGKISPDAQSITGIIQTELLRVFTQNHPVSPEELKHLSLESYKNYMTDYFSRSNLSLDQIFTDEILDVFTQQIIDKTNLENYLIPGYIMMIFPVPFDQNLKPLNKENLRDADNLRFLLLEDSNSKASLTIYQGTYIQKILPSEFLDCAFKIPDFETNKPLSNEFKEDLKQKIQNSIQKIKELCY